MISGRYVSLGGRGFWKGHGRNGVELVFSEFLMFQDDERSEHALSNCQDVSGCRRHL